MCCWNRHSCSSISLGTSHLAHQHTLSLLSCLSFTLIVNSFAPFVRFFSSCRVKAHFSIIKRRVVICFNSAHNNFNSVWITYLTLALSIIKRSCFSTSCHGRLESSKTFLCSKLASRERHLFNDKLETHLATFQIPRILLARRVESHRNQKTDFKIAGYFGDRDTGRVGCCRVIEGIYSRN